MAATIEELKDMIVDLRVTLAKKNIQVGHCPYAYISLEKPKEDENCDDCTGCRTRFFQKYKAIIAKEVAQL